MLKVNKLKKYFVCNFLNLFFCFWKMFHVGAYIMEML